MSGGGKEGVREVIEAAEEEKFLCSCITDEKGEENAYEE